MTILVYVLAGIGVVAILAAIVIFIASINEKFEWLEAKINRIDDKKQDRWTGYTTVKPVEQPFNKELIGKRIDNLQKFANDLESRFDDLYFETEKYDEYEERIEKLERLVNYIKKYLHNADTELEKRDIHVPAPDNTEGDSNE